MKSNKYKFRYGILFLVTTVIFYTSCTKGFEEINKNPNLINEISPGTLLNEILYNVSSNNMTNSYNINSQLMQVQLEYPKIYGGIQRFEILETTGNSQWNSAYKWIMNLNDMVKVSEAEDAKNYQAIALTLRAWIYSNLTDNFGDIPFSEASKADEGIIQAKYDDQKEIYAKLIQDLENANSLYDHSQKLIYGTELLFENNTQKWQKFTNSLHLRLLLRTSNQNPEALKLMKSILEDSKKYPIIDNQEESVVYKITGVAPSLSPWSRPLDFSNQHAVGSFFIELLNQLNDPRRSIYVTPAKSNNGTTLYKGIPSGYDETSLPYSPSYMNNLQVTAPMIIPIFSYAELCFIKAELGQKNIISGAETNFKEGVKAAVSLWTNEEVSENYFDNDLAKYDGTLERIILHKYLALYLTDFQQWTEYRRTGFPVLPKTTSMLNNGFVPERLMYPALQKIYNPINYESAIGKIGGDKINVKMFWAKK